MTLLLGETSIELVTHTIYKDLTSFCYDKCILFERPVCLIGFEFLEFLSIASMKGAENVKSKCECPPGVIKSFSL